jgi:hypothetical protein
VIVAVDQADQRDEESLTLLRKQRSEQTLLRPLHRPVHLLGQLLPGGRQSCQHHAPVIGAAAPLQQTPSGEAVEDVGDIRPVDAELAPERILVDIGIERQRGQQAILDRCDVESCALLEEQGVVDLVQPTQQIARSRPQRHVGMQALRTQLAPLRSTVSRFAFGLEYCPALSCRFRSLTCRHLKFQFCWCKPSF